MKRGANLDSGKLLSEGLFGLLDGLNGCIGLIVGLLHSHAATDIIVTAVVARAGASAVSMGGAEYEADEDAENRTTRLARVFAIALGYLTSALLPGLGYTVSRSFGNLMLIPVSAVLLLVICAFRAKRHGWFHATALTLSIFAAAVGIGYASSLIAGSS